MSDIKIKAEPLTYERNAPQSFFKDTVLARNGDTGSARRLERHAQEMRVVLPAREIAAEKRAVAEGPDGLAFEYRVNPSRVDGTGGYFAAPLWLIDEFATAPRLDRTLSRLIPNLPLPAGVSDVNLPRLTTGTRVTPQAGDNGAVSNRDIVDASASQPVTTFAGIADVSLQLLEQSPAGPHLDWAIFSDMRSSYIGQLETALINGAGTDSAFAGILNLATGTGGVNAITYTDASPTAAAMAVAWSKAFAQVGDTRSMPPEVWLMRSARWAWYGAADTNVSSGPRRFLGAPVELDDAILPTLGGAGPANGTQDTVIAMRPSDSILLESAQRTDVKFEPLSGVLMARLTLYVYATALHRQPTGIAKVNGTGMVVQAGYS